MSSLGHDLHLLVARLDRAADRILAPIGLNYRRYVTLLLIDELGEGTQRALADALGVSEPAVSRMVGALQAAALATATAAAGHRKQVRITDEGRRVLTTATEALGGSLDGLVRDLGLDPERLATDLRTIHRALES